MDHHALLQKFFELCPNGLCLCSVKRSAAGTIEEAVPIAVNEAFCVHAGQPDTELIGRPLHLILRNFYLLTQKYFASLHDLGQSFTLELQLEPVHKPVTVTVFFLDDDHLMVILQDATEHQVAEAALLSIGEMWAFSLEGEGDGVWDWEIPQKTIHYSRRFKEILGISDELSDVDDFDFKDRIHPEEVERVSLSIHEHVKGLTNNYVQEHRMRSDEGSYRWVITRGKVIKRTPDGRALRMIGTLTDTSERRMITEALQRSQQWLSAFFQNKTHGFGVVDRQNTLFLVNETLARMAGGPVTAIAHRKLNSIIVPVDWQTHVSRAIAAIWNGHESAARMEIRVQVPQSEPLWVECSLSPIVNSQKQVEAIAGIFTDITDRKRTAAALHLEQEKLRHSTWMLERRVQELTCLYEVVNHLEQVNVSLSEKLQAVVEAVPAAFQLPQDTCARLEVEDQVYLSRDFVAHENSRIHPFLFAKNRRGCLEVFVSSAATPPTGEIFLQEEQAFLQSVATQLVLTLEQHFTLEDNQFLSSRLRQSQKVEAMGRLTHFVADDFQGVLEQFSENLTGLRPHLAENPDATDRYDRVQTVLHEGSRMVRQLAFFSKNRPLSANLTDPAQLFEPILAQFQTRYGKRIRFNLQTAVVAGQTTPLDRDYVSLLADQLLQNAADSILHMGNVHVTLARVHLDHEADDHLPPGMYLQLQIADTGVGMDAEELTHLFEPFYSTKNHRKNAGLGLFVVLGIMKLHHGAVRVRSTPGHGTVFTCLFPEIQKN
ncbi:MAG: hypothetical protein CVU65_01290 [Deltaproteobacteria bacterium HGW-Deltaproteobacteria-22]|jgi:PAS domain S-box-containing protein|nr:MAG: hypothetical protein CVU65_01290 [Deltaproteobacteria bacterium HGW-Deltaproteobacteria-22]